MKLEDCQVCSIKSTCTGEGVFLHAPTDILAVRLRSVLRDGEIPFSQHDRMFAVAAQHPREQLLHTLQCALSSPESDALRVTFDLLNLMGATSLTQAARRAETHRFQEALQNDSFVHWFQPIVNPLEGRLVGHECLIRLQANGDGSRFYSGQEIIDAAIERGDLHVFDSHSRRTAIRNAAQRHTGGLIFINFAPSSIYDPAFCMASTLKAMESTHLTPADVVFEVVECERIPDTRHLRKIADYYRERGFSIALDDVGTGSNSLQMLPEIQPEYIKLDKSIVWQYDTPVGLKTIRKLAELGAETGIRVIAEGIETEKMRDSLLECGITLMQGYFFGRPAPEMKAQTGLVASR